MSVNLFDANFYRAANPDLAILNDTQALSHFQTYGLEEGRNFSPLVDFNFYRASNADIASYNNHQAYEHLQNYGVAEGRRFSPLVDLNFYRAANVDLAKFNNEQILSHLQTYGVAEGRSFSPVADLNFYRAYYKDLASLNNNQALQHLKIYGLNEGRLFSQFFDINYYKSYNPDLVTAALSNSQLLEHFELNGLNEGRKFSLPFELKYYKSLYPDLTKLNNSQLLQHFELNGLNEGRASSPNFNVRYYLSHNSDLIAAGFNYEQALDHFLLYGNKQGRSGVALPIQQWQQDFGSFDDEYFSDFSSDIAVDSAGNVYITGETMGVLGTNRRGSDVWLAKYDTAGNRLWTQQFGTNTYDSAKSIKVDRTGNVYITGETTGALAGTNRGGSDVWLAKYNAAGNRLWIKQFGTSSHEYCSDVAIDRAGNVYIVGATDGGLAQANAGYSDAFLAKYDTRGDRQWIQQFSTYAPDTFNGVAVDSENNVYVTGNTSSYLDNGENAAFQKAWLVKYDTFGNRIWLQKSNTASYNNVALDTAGNIYVTGSDVTNNPATGSRETTLSKYNSSGINLWTQYSGSIPSSFGGSTSDIAVDSANNVYVLVQVSTGSGSGSYSVLKYDSSGYRGKQYSIDYRFLFAPPWRDNELVGIAVDSASSLYLTGETSIPLGSISETKAWVAKLSQPVGS